MDVLHRSHVLVVLRSFSLFCVAGVPYASSQLSGLPSFVAPRFCLLSVVPVAGLWAPISFFSGLLPSFVSSFIVSFRLSFPGGFVNGPPKPSTVGRLATRLLVFLLLWLSFFVNVQL